MYLSISAKFRLALVQSPRMTCVSGPNRLINWARHIKSPFNYELHPVRRDSIESRFVIGVCAAYDMLVGLLFQNLAHLAYCKWKCSISD